MLIKVLNKGLDKSDSRVNKYVQNYKHKEFLKIYILNTPNNEILEFFGKKNLCNYIKNINSTLNFKSRINVNNLIKNKSDKGYILDLK